MLGLAGGLHCFGMCGGIASALRMATPNQHSHWPYTLSYNSGRIISYALAGSLAGALGQMGSRLPGGPAVLGLISGLLLLAMAAYLGRWWLGLTWLERQGAGLWRYLQPLSQHFVPFSSPLAAFPYGLIWGWLPCGLVYSTLSWALASGSAVDGGLIMLCFGLGTLPALVATAFGAQWLMTRLQQGWVRQCLALMIALFALAILTRAIQHLLMG